MKSSEPITLDQGLVGCGTSIPSGSGLPAGVPGDADETSGAPHDGGVAPDSGRDIPDDGSGGSDDESGVLDDDGNYEATFGGEDHDAANALVETADGGLALAGYTGSYSSDSREDMYLVRTDANGNELWSKTFGGESEDKAYALVETSDGGFALAGYTYSFGAGGSNLYLSDMYLVRTDANGNELWNKTFGGESNDKAYALVETSDGGFALAGYSSSFSAGYRQDMYLVRTDANGNELWSKTFDGTRDSIANALVETVDGGLVLAGSNTSTYFREECAPLGGGSLCVSVGVSAGDVVLVKTDGNGDELWTKDFGRSQDSQAYALVETSDGGIAIAGKDGHKDTDYDMYLIRTDASGNELWTTTYGGAEDDQANSLVETSDGGFALAGRTSSFGAARHNMYLLRTCLRSHSSGA